MDVMCRCWSSLDLKGKCLLTRPCRLPDGDPRAGVSGNNTGRPCAWYSGEVAGMTLEHSDLERFGAALSTHQQSQSDPTRGGGMQPTSASFLECRYCET